MCAGRATHQPTSNGEENIACRNKSLIRGVSRLFQKQKPLSAPGREWRAALRAGNSSTGPTKVRIEYRIFLLAFPIHP